MRRIVALLLHILAFPLGAGALLAASLACAKFASSPVAFISAGVLACVLATLALSYLALRLLRRINRWPAVALASGATTLIIFAVFAAYFLQPLVPSEKQFVRHIPNDVALWELNTGSVVAVRKIAAQGTPRANPVVFLHGGPGAYSVSLRATVDVVSQLSGDGYDVYFYDQIGGGLSERLEDIAEYSIERHLLDLDAVHTRIGAAKVILIGSSWGASLGANYMAEHPEKVFAAVFSGVGPIYHPDWHDSRDGGLDARLNPAQRDAFASMVETPRLYAALVLADINPRAAVRFAGEHELGSLFDNVANAFYLPIAVCDMQGVDAESSGYGFWSNRMTSKTLQARTRDPKPSLRTNHTPVLVLRGECDYKAAAVAREYAEVFPNARLELIEATGHMLYWEEPDAYLQRVRRFLTRTHLSNQRHSNHQDTPCKQPYKPFQRKVHLANR